MRPIGRIMVVLAALLGGVGLASSAQALTLNVAMNGVDNDTCGKAGTPCRTISQAVVNADAGDRILVGPGVYGDVNQDNNLLDIGEEKPEDRGVPLHAADHQASHLRIVGRRRDDDHPRDLRTSLTAVSLEASGISFGVHNRGFTITTSITSTAIGTG